MTNTSSSEWISVAALEKGFAPESYALDHSADLSGKHFTLNGPENLSRVIGFGHDQVILDDVSHDGVRITSIRDGIYLVDWLEARTSYSLIIDTLTGSFTQVIGHVPSFAEIDMGMYKKALSGRPLTDIRTEISHGTLDRPYSDDACAHALTTELIGKRNMYRYSPTEVYEHIYLNPHFYTWQCLKGVEQGLTDTDFCHYYKIAEQLYLFIWQEKIVPTLGLVMVDEINHRSDGKICGLGDSETAPISNFAMASYCQRLGEMEYPDDL